MALVSRPRAFTPNIKASTIKDFTGKMGTFKGKRGLRAGEFKKVCDSSAAIKNNPHLRAAAHNIYKSMKGAGPRNMAVRTHHGKQFIKEYGKALKAMGGEGGIKATKFGRKKVIEAPKAAGHKLVEEQLKTEKPAGPSKKDILRTKKRNDAIKTLNIRKAVERRKESEGEFKLHRETKEGGKDSKTEDSSGHKSTAVPMSGTSLPHDPRQGTQGSPDGEGFSPSQGEDTDFLDESGDLPDTGISDGEEDTQIAKDQDDMPNNTRKNKGTKPKKEVEEPDVGGLFDT